MFYMAKEIRMAGCDPTRAADAGITTANANSISFTEDITDGAAGAPDGDTSDANESITYSLAAGDLWRDDVNGIGNQRIASNIDALNFVYLAGDRTPLATPVATLEDIRSVQIAIVARTGRRDLGYTNNKTYQNFQGATIYTAPGDNFRRKLLMAEIQCRNLGF